MQQFMEEQCFAQNLLADLDRKRMLETIHLFNGLHRYTGTPAGEAAAAYLEQELTRYGMDCNMLSYEAFLSRPLSATFDVTAPQAMRLQAIADVFSGSAENLCGELVYDAASERTDLTYHEQQKRFAGFGGKIVLTHADSAFAHEAHEAGALAVVHINNTPGGYIHHRGIGTVWGNPSLETRKSHSFAVSVGICMEDGQRLIELLKADRLTVSITVSMEHTTRVSSMPVVTIPGKRPEYLLISCHYDSWYEGITDNAAANAIALELARLFWNRRDALERGVRIAWWSGHSDGRYAGSAWYCDQMHNELRKYCVAHLNLDLAGCKGADQIIARTTCMEGMDFTADLIEQFTGRRPTSYTPMIRGADQSFWGVNIPIVIMPKFEPLPENRVSSCPSGGPWWHTDQDTIDKLDEAILLRDAQLMGTMACIVANAPTLPVRPIEFVKEMRRHLQIISKTLDASFSLSPVYQALDELEPLLECFEQRLKALEPSGSDSLAKRVAGELVRLAYSYGSRFMHDPAVGQGPFTGLRLVTGQKEGDCPPEVMVAARTTFTQQLNRLVEGLEELTALLASMEERKCFH